jgi:pimeloyl-ACP methyl ester carboxylesterase
MATLDSALLRRRLAYAGFAPRLFRYHSTRSSLEEITAALAAELRAAGPQVHVIGHSLGGVIAFETFDRHADLPPGRVVLMGAPVRGARAAQSLARHAFGQAVLGPLAISQLAQPRERRWTVARELGLIAGSRSIGVGRYVARLPRPNDGTVALDETELPGALARVVHDSSHIGMLLSSAVATAVTEFLRHGRMSADGRQGA